jgi:hypothetical protein
MRIFVAGAALLGLIAFSFSMGSPVEATSAASINPTELTAMSSGLTVAEPSDTI